MGIFIMYMLVYHILYLNKYSLLEEGMKESPENKKCEILTMYCSVLVLQKNSTPSQGLRIEKI